MRNHLLSQQLLTIIPCLVCTHAITSLEVKTKRKLCNPGGNTCTMDPPAPCSSDFNNMCDHGNRSTYVLCNVNPNAIKYSNEKIKILLPAVYYCLFIFFLILCKLMNSSA
jgi:hypothetical protein